MNNTQIQVELQETMGGDFSVANAAWSSTYDKDKREAKYDEPDKIRMVIEKGIFGGKHVHTVPLEAAQFRFWYRWPIMIDRQHVTHRIMSHNGLSGRYRTMPTDYFAIPEDVIIILNKVDDWSGTYDNLDPFLRELYISSCEMSINNYKVSIQNLKKALQDKWITNEEYKRAREIIRGQLPLSTMVERTSIMNLNSFSNYIRLRMSSEAQPEIQQVARMMLEQVEKSNICPITLACLKQREWSL
jgi:flavin-dependent thymidylate synthase